jgi:hypothetical protein
MADQGKTTKKTSTGPAFDVFESKPDLPALLAAFAGRSEPGMDSAGPCLYL